MLVLSRKRNEGVTISHPAGDIHVTVVEIRGNKIRLGFTGPRAVAIRRDEVLEVIREETNRGQPGAPLPASRPFEVQL